MNPLLQVIREVHGRNNLTQGDAAQADPAQQILADIQAGKVDPKKKALEMLGNLNPLQKMALKAAMPMLQRVGRKQGIPENDINEFSAEVQRIL